MKRTATIALALILALLAATACESARPSFLEAFVSPDGKIAGTVQNGDPAKHKLLVYINDAEPPYRDANNAPFRSFDESSGIFSIDIQGISANSAALYLVPGNVDFSSIKNVVDKSYDKRSLVLTPMLAPEATPEPGPMPEPTPTQEPAAEPTFEPTPEPTPELDEFYMFEDDSDSLSANRHMDYGYMPTAGGGIAMDENNASYAYSGEESIRFSFTPTNTHSWGGVALLWMPGEWDVDPGENGPDPAIYRWCTFKIRGGEGLGDVKVYIEGDDGSQSLETIILTDEWQEVRLPVEAGWSYVKTPFAWVANQNDPDERGGMLEFYLDDLKYTR